MDDDYSLFTFRPQGSSFKFITLIFSIASVMVHWNDEVLIITKITTTKINLKIKNKNPAWLSRDLQHSSQTRLHSATKTINMMVSEETVLSLQDGTCIIYICKQTKPNLCVKVLKHFFSATFKHVWIIIFGSFSCLGEYRDPS